VSQPDLRFGHIFSEAASSTARMPTHITSGNSGQPCRRRWRLRRWPSKCFYNQANTTDHAFTVA